MTQVEVFSGICGFTTHIEVEDQDDYMASCTIKSECPNLKKVAAILDGNPINVMDELFKKGESKVFLSCQSILPHVSCPAPAAILKALEVGVGLALPKDASVKFIKEEN